MNAAIPIETDILPSQSQPPQLTRYILTRLEDITLVFPSTLVAQISILERSQILALPFYNLAMLGIIHHRGQIMPLISLRQVMGFPLGLSVETLTAVRLGAAAGDLADIGLIVDMTLGMRTSDQLPPDLLSADRLPNLTNSEPKMRLFQPEILASHLWQSRRW
jgi:hypothetical protein